MVNESFPEVTVPEATRLYLPPSKAHAPYQGLQHANLLLLGLPAQQYITTTLDQHDDVDVFKLCCDTVWIVNIALGQNYK